MDEMMESGMGCVPESKRLNLVERLRQKTAEAEARKKLADRALEILEKNPQMLELLNILHQIGGFH